MSDSLLKSASGTGTPEIREGTSGILPPNPFILFVEGLGGPSEEGVRKDKGEIDITKALLIYLKIIVLYFPVFYKIKIFSGVGYVSPSDALTAVHRNPSDDESDCSPSVSGVGEEGEATRKAYRVFFGQSPYVARDMPSS